MKSNAWQVLGAMLSMGSAHAGNDLSNLAWLAGCWQSGSGEMATAEHWLAPAGDTMIGVSRTVRAGATVAFEYMQIRREADGSLAFVAQPGGRPPTVFPLLSIAPHEAVFENTGNDFPQRIIYASTDGNRLDARIEGVRNGERRVVDFPMRRVRCDAPAPSSPPIESFRQTRCDPRA